jgi:hypothetical protein
MFISVQRANEHFHHCSGGHFKIFPLYKVNTEGDFLRRKETLLINILKPTLNDKGNKQLFRSHLIFK